MAVSSGHQAGTNSSTPAPPSSRPPRRTTIQHLRNALPPTDHGPTIHNRQPEDEIRLTDRPKIIIIGGGPNRIGQGIEFDYCCVQAAFACRELGIESVMINSNPETVSTDYDTSDLLFFEPLTHEDVLNVCERCERRAIHRGGVTFVRQLENHAEAVENPAPDAPVGAGSRCRLRTSTGAD